MFSDNFMFNVFPVIFGIVFILIFGFILFTMLSGVKQGIKNNNSPLLTVPAEVVTKRISVHGDHSSTTYYVTFEVQSGDRMEFTVGGTDYGKLVEQDLGLLSFKGTRYVSFEREK